MISFVPVSVMEASPCLSVPSLETKTYVAVQRWRSDISMMLLFLVSMPLFQLRSLVTSTCSTSP